MKKIIAIAMAAVMLAMTAGCAKKPGTDADTDTTANGSDTKAVTTEAVTEKPVELDLPSDLYYNDEELRLLVRTTSLPYHDYVESENMTIVDQAVFDRNTAVEEQLGLSFRFFHMNGFSSGSAAFQTAIRNAVSGGGDSYHIVSPGSYFGTQLIPEGCYQLLNDLPHMDLKESYWWKGYVDVAAVNGKIYTVTGDFSVDALACMEAVFFNKSIITAYALEDPYELVKNGEWTLDKMLSMAKTVSSDQSDANKIYGLIIGKDGMRAIPNGCDSFCVVKDAKGELKIDLVNEKNSSIIDKMKAAIELESVQYWHKVNPKEMYPIFKESRALFMMRSIEEARTLNDSSVNYGILISPKYDSQQKEYVTGVIGDTVFAIPSAMSEKETEKAAAALQAFGYYSYLEVTPAYFETTLQGRIAKDEQSYYMLEMIRDTIQYDFAQIYLRFLPGLTDALPDCVDGSKFSNLSTWYAANGSPLEVALGELVLNDKFK